MEPSSDIRLRMLARKNSRSPPDKQSSSDKENHVPSGVVQGPVKVDRFWMNQDLTDDAIDIKSMKQKLLIHGYIREYNETVMCISDSIYLVSCFLTGRHCLEPQ